MRVGRIVLAWLVGVGSVQASAPGQPALQRFEFDQVEMSVPVRLVLYAADEATATGASRAAFARIHALNSIMSDYDEQSELRRLGASSGGGKAVVVSEDLWHVVRFAQELSQRSEGAFDISINPVVRLWRRARRTAELPSPERLQAARAMVDYRRIRLDPDQHAIELLKPGMRLDLGGVAKGYAAQEALAVLKGLGIPRAMIHAGGDIALGDPPPGRNGWRIAVAPLRPDAPPSRYLSLANVAVATSGDTWQFVDIGGRRYSHIVDPRTGIGLTDHCSVTIIASDGMAADGLATAVCVLGPQQGLKLVEDTPGVAAFLVRAPDGKPKTYESSRWKDLPLASPN